MGRVVIGVDLGGTNVRTALVSPEGVVLAKHKEATLAAEGWVKVVALLKKNIQHQLDTARLQGHTVISVGVGAPGVIDVDKGVVVKSPNFPDWDNLPLRAELERVLGLPVILENDANAAALGEMWHGAGRGLRSIVLLTLGTGVGGGIILDKKIWHGADGMAGEIGHMTLLPEGRPCGCGNTGCLEMYASARGIVLSFREALEKNAPASPGAEQEITSEFVYQAARDGNVLAKNVMADMGRMLGIGIANVINIFNPEMIVIGGGVMDAWQLFIDATRREIVKRAFQVTAERTRVVPALLGDDAGMVGAAAVALERA